MATREITIRVDSDSFLEVEQVISKHPYAKPSIQSLSSPGSKPRPILTGHPPRLHLYLSTPLNVFINPTPDHLLCSFVFTLHTLTSGPLHGLPLSSGTRFLQSSRSHLFIPDSPTFTPSLLQSHAPALQPPLPQNPREKCLPHSIYPMLLGWGAIPSVMLTSEGRIV